MLSLIIRTCAWIGWGMLLCVMLLSKCHASEAYPTQEAAAIAAVNACIDRSTAFEYAGGIYQDHGQFFYTVPYSSGSERDVETFKLRVPKSARLVALYHTHPMTGLPGDNSEFISDADISTANNMGIASYVGILKTHKIVVYIPHITPIVFKQDSLHSDIHLSYGKPIGAL